MSQLLRDKTKIRMRRALNELRASREYALDQGSIALADYLQAQIQRLEWIIENTDKVLRLP